MKTKDVLNKPMSRRSFLRGAAAAAASAAVVAACVPVAQPPAAPAATEAPGSAPAPSQAGSDKPYAGTNLNVLTFRYTYTEATEFQLPEFEELTGIKVTYDVFAEAEESQKATVELAGGTGAYHVTHISGSGLPQYAEPGWILDLEPFLEDPNLTDPDEFELDDFVKGPWESGQWKGKQYGVPVFVGTQLFYYRTDIIDKAPETFDELLEKAKEVHDNPIPAFAVRGARGKDAASWPFPQFLLGFGANWFQDYPNDMHPTLDSPEAIRAAEYWVELLSNYGIPNVASANFDEVLLALSEGNAAMAIEGAPLAARLFDPEQSKVADKLGMAIVPSGPAGRFPPFSGHTWAIPTAADHHEAAWEFIKWSVSKEVQLNGALNTNHIAVTRKSVWNDPEFQEKYSYGGGSKFVDLFLQSAEEGEPTYRPPLPEWSQLGDRLSIALNEAVTGQKTAEQAMTDLQEDMYELFKKAGYYES